MEICGWKQMKAAWSEDKFCCLQTTQMPLKNEFEFVSMSELNGAALDHRTIFNVQVLFPRFGNSAARV